MERGLKKTALGDRLSAVSRITEKSDQLLGGKVCSQLKEETGFESNLLQDKRWQLSNDLFGNRYREI